MRALLLCLLASSAVAGVTAGVPLADPAASGERGLRARVLFTASRLGAWAPCECPDAPLGGLAQEADLVATARAQGPTFWLDAGDRFFALDMALNDAEEDARRLGALALLDAGSVAGLDALGVGRKDLGAGVDYLRKLSLRATYPFVSANLLGPDGQAVFSPSVMLERGGLALGVTSVLPPDDRGEGFVAVDPYRAARDQVKALRARGAELVVVLSNLGLDADARLARVSGADLILGSGSRELLAEGQRVGRSVLGHAGSRGRYLGDARIYAQGPRPGPATVVTLLPVLAAGPVHPDVTPLVQSLEARLRDGTLGMPGMAWDAWLERRGR